MSEIRGTKREGFTGELWRSIEIIYDEILAHPFLQGLTDGTLSDERFHFYVLQSTLPICKKFAHSGKAPVISELPTEWIFSESLSIL